MSGKRNRAVDVVFYVPSEVGLLIREGQELRLTVGTTTLNEGL